MVALTSLNDYTRIGEEDGDDDNGDGDGDDDDNDDDDNNGNGDDDEDDEDQEIIWEFVPNGGPLVAMAMFQHNLRWLQFNRGCISSKH